MKALMLYRPVSEFARAAEEFEHEFRVRTGRQIEVLDIDSIEGTQKATLYDIMQFPAVLVVQENGQLLKSWTGDKLPLVNDVLGYLVS